MVEPNREFPKKGANAHRSTPFPRNRLRPFPRVPDYKDLYLEQVGVASEIPSRAWADKSVRGG
jgi:hypothetical protein